MRSLSYLTPISFDCTTQPVSDTISMMKTIIVAYDKNRGIGANNDLLWKHGLPADLQRFKELTTGSTVIMGSNTYYSIGRPLPHRDNIVINFSNIQIDGVTVVTSLDDAYKAAMTKDLFVIGGGQIYKLALDSVDQIKVTEVQASFKADVFFPEIDMDKWQEVARESHQADEMNKYAYDFVTYARR